jgi:hypothetical protein
MRRHARAKELTMTTTTTMTMSNRFFRVAILYLLLGVSLGITMGASGDHSLFPLHAHLNLLGWVSMTLFGLFYRAFPDAAQTRLAKAHFWIYIPAHFVQMVLLGSLLRGNPGVEPALGAASVLVALAILCFAVVLWTHTSEASGPRSVVRPNEAPV